MEEMTNFPWWGQLIIALAGMFGTAALEFLRRYLSKLGELAAEKTKFAKLGRVDDVIMTAVEDTYTKLVKHAKAAAADGKLSAEEKKKFAQIPLQAAKDAFSIKTLVDVLSTSEEKLDEVLDRRVSTAVAAAKRAGKAAGK